MRIVGYIIFALLLPTGAAIGWFVHGVLNAPPTQTAKDVFSQETRNCMAAEMAEGGTTQADMVQILAVIINNKKGNGRLPQAAGQIDYARMPCEAFERYTHMRAPSDEGTRGGVRTVGCALSQGLEGMLLPGLCKSAARRARAALALSIVDEYIATGTLPEAEEPIDDEAVKYVRVSGHSVARTDVDKMTAELGEKHTLSTGLITFRSK